MAGKNHIVLPTLFHSKGRRWLRPAPAALLTLALCSQVSNGRMGDVGANCKPQNDREVRSSMHPYAFLCIPMLQYWNMTLFTS